MLLKIYQIHAARRLCGCVRRRYLSSDTSASGKRVIFSGIQPTGCPHLGNYLGAIKQWVELQKEKADILYSIVDLHALTVENDGAIDNRTLEIAACLIACGVDPNRSIVFKQSEVKEHTMLSWVLSCMVQQNMMKHMVQWKEKSKVDRRAANLGLFTYPMLQCADILLYKATDVPVGQDQKPHLELCQSVAKSFNHRYGDYFPVPKYLSDPDCTKIKSLRDPFSKMSKSEKSQVGKINISDTDGEIWHKIKRAVTDDTSAVTFDPIRRPGVSNLIQIHSSISGLPIDDICARAQKEELETGQYKMAVAEAVLDHIRPLRTEYENLLENKEYINSVLSKGAEKARAISAKNWSEIAKLVGLR